MGQIDLNEVGIFVKVVEAGGFSAAARLANLPKSTVSRKVARLEASLGGRLLQRTTRKLHLTEQGAAFFDRVRVALAQVNDAATLMAELQNEPTGHLKVTTPNDFASLFMGKIAQQFCALHPGITLEVVATARTMDLVGEGIDVAIRAGALRDSSLVARQLLVENWYLFASPAYLDTHGIPKTLEELAHHDCVVFTGSHRGARWQLIGPDGVETVIHAKGTVFGNEFGFVRDALIAGAGIGFMPAFLCAQHVRSGRLSPVLPDHHLRAGAMHLVYPSSRYLPAKVKLFRDFMLAWVAKGGWEET